MGHLAYFIGTGEIEIDTIVSIEKQLLVKAVAEKYGTESHKVLLENLPRNFTYGEIAMVLASMKVPSV